MADSRERLRRVLDGILESILEAPEDELDDDLRALGKDPEEVVARGRELANQAIDEHRRRRLAEARARFEKERETLEEREVDLPPTARGRLDLLVAALGRQPWLNDMLTVQHRELRGLTDEDVVTYLRQLAELGLLDEP